VPGTTSYSAQQQLEDLKAHLRTVDPDVKAAQVDVTRLKVAQGWTSGKPRYLACIRDLTAIFPEEGSTYATTVTLRSTSPARFRPRSQRTEGAPSVGSDREGFKHFRNVKLGEVREAGRNSREIAFTISFVYQPE